MATSTIGPGLDYETIQAWHDDVARGPDDVGVLDTSGTYAGATITKSSLILQAGSGCTPVISGAGNVLTVQVGGTSPFTIQGLSESERISITGTTDGTEPVKTWGMFAADYVTINATNAYCIWTEGPPTGYGTRLRYLRHITCTGTPLGLLRCVKQGLEDPTSLYCDEITDCIGSGAQFINATWLTSYSGDPQVVARNNWTLTSADAHIPMGYRWGSTSATFANNLFIVTGDCGTTGLMYVPHGARNHIYNNTLIGPGGSPTGSGIYCYEEEFHSTDRVDIRNNIVTGFDGGIEAYTSALGDYNCSYGNTTNWPSSVPAVHDITEDPQFVGGGDYHLTSISPCWEAGTDTGQTPDLDGASRPQCENWDMGCYELPPPPTSISSVVSGGRVHSVVTFDQGMTKDAALETTTNYSLTPTDGGVAVTITEVEAGAGTYPTEVTLTHTPVTEDKHYTLDALDLLTDRWGNALFGLSATLDTTDLPPVVSSVAFEDAWTIHVHFSEEMNEDSEFLDPDNYVITTGGSGVIPDIDTVEGADYSGGNPTTAVLHITKVTLNEIYTVTVSDSVTDVDDDLGVDEDFNSGEASIATGYPYLSLAVNNNETNEITITASEDLYGSGLASSSNWSVMQGATELGVELAEHAGHGPTIVLTTTDTLTNNLVYDITYSGSAQDVANNALQPAGKLVSFTAALGPRMLSAVVVNVYHTRVTFDVPVVSGLDTPGNYTLTAGGGVTGTVTAVVASGGNTIATLEHNELTGGLNYSATATKANLLAANGLGIPTGQDSQEFLSVCEDPRVSGLSLGFQEGPVTVTFSEGVNSSPAGDITDPTKWLLKTSGGFPAVIDSIDHVGDSDTAVLNLDDYMRDGHEYIVTAPETVIDLSLNPISELGRNYTSSETAYPRPVAAWNLEGLVGLVYSMDMRNNANLINKNYYAVKDSLGASVTINSVIRVGPKTVWLYLDSVPNPLEEYTVTVQTTPDVIQATTLQYVDHWNNTVGFQGNSDPREIHCFYCANVTRVFIRNDDGETDLPYLVVDDTSILVHNDPEHQDVADLVLVNDGEELILPDKWPIE